MFLLLIFFVILLLTSYFQYKKPSAILDMEKTLQAEFSKLKASKDGDVDCTPSWSTFPFNITV